MSSTELYEDTVIFDGITSPVGIGVQHFNFNDTWAVTGYPSRKFTKRNWDGAYEFEAFIKKSLDCSKIEFDSEYCQFFAYFENKSQAEKFVNDVDNLFKEQNNEPYL